jgi:hypothetical protein
MRTSACLLTVVLWVMPSVAFAQQQPPEDVEAAAQAFAEAQRAQLRGEPSRAAELFEIADQAAPSPAALRSAIRNREAAGQPVRAATLALRAQQRYPDDRETRELANATIERLSPRLVRARALCNVPCSLLVDGGLVGPPATTVDFFVTEGPHAVEARWPRRKTLLRTVESSLGSSIEFTITAPPELPQAPAQPAPAGKGPAEESAPLVPAAAPQPPARDEGEVSSDGGGLPPAVFWTGAVLTVVAGGVLTWSGLDTLSARDDYKKAPTKSGYDHGVKLETRTNILAATTAVLGAATLGVALFATDWGGKASVALGPSQVALSLDMKIP